MKLRDFVQTMKHSPIHNYAIPGLTSWLIGGMPGDHGVVRLFECNRDHQEPITPHSHRFDFHCMVLAGTVKNILWTGVQDTLETANPDRYTVSELDCSGRPGEYKREEGYNAVFNRTPVVYKKGEEYSMKADEIHSIFFSAGAEVLFFEGPQKDSSSVILEPFVDGQTIPTFRVEEWMFKRSTK